MNTNHKSALIPTALVAVGCAVILHARAACAASSICVDPAGKGGCLTTIGAAIAAANPGDTVQVNKGTYPEIVVIDKALSLVGANAKNTIIDVATLSTTIGGNPIASGIFVDGIDNAGLSGVLISGFTVQNANFEGILVANASSVTVANNTVKDNNKALSGANCPGIATFETNEAFDCGEGIHLLGADHSTVSNNLVENNAGGILISDDTSLVHDNLISGNTVKNNASDCGITLASHTPAALTGSAIPLGVIHNTVSGNTSMANGLLTGEGAGIGIFDSVPNANNSGNVVVGNTVTGNALPGIAMHGHTPGQTLADNQIIGNTISKNGADKTPTATGGTTGIDLISTASAATGTIIAGNTIKNEAFAIVINTIPTGNVDAHLNNLKGKGVGIENDGSSIVDGSQNFWGCAKGPGAKGCSSVGGTGTVLATPFASKAF